LCVYSLTTMYYIFICISILLIIYILHIYKPTLNQFDFNNQFITKLSLIRDKFIIFRCFLSIFMIYDVQKSMIHVNTLKIRGKLLYTYPTTHLLFNYLLEPS